MGQFSLHAGTWGSWQMLPGYFGERMTPYCSPIFVRRVEPLKTGKRILRVDFFNALYAQGVQDFSVDLKVIKRASNYLIAEFIDDTDRSAVIGHMEFLWLEEFCPSLCVDNPRGTESSVSNYLDAVFGRQLSG